MIVSCENCGAKYKLDPARVTGRGVRITCPRCKNVFAVYSHQEQELEDPSSPAPASPSALARPVVPVSAAAPAPAPASAATAPAAARPSASSSLPAPPAAPPAAPSASSSPAPAVASAALPPPPSPARPDVSSLDFAAVGIQAWKVKVAIGLVYDFSDYKTLARYIKDGRVGDNDQISHDGKSWTVLKTIDDLPEHFHQVYLAALRRMEKVPTERGPTGEFDDDSPTMIVGASTLAGTFGGGALPRETGTQPDDIMGLSAALAAAEADEDASVHSDPGLAGPAGPRFQDPFAKARARTAATAGKRKGSGGGPPPPPSSSAESAPGSRRSMVMVIGLGALVGAAAVGAWSVINGQSNAVDIEVAGPVDPQQELLQRRQKEIAEAEAIKTIKKVQDELAGTMERETTDAAFVDPNEDVYAPVTPSGRGSSQGAGAGSVSADPSGGTMSAASPSTAADYYDAGRSASAKGDHATASSSFRQAVNAEPTNATYRENLGLALMNLGSDSEATAELSEATRRGSARAWIYLGDIASRQGDTAGAIGYYQKFLELDPGNASVKQKIDALTR